MKKILTHLLIAAGILYGLTTASTATAQTSSDAKKLQTIGENVGKTLEEFAKGVDDAGFSRAKENDIEGLKTLKLNGRLAGQRNCLMLTAANKDGDGRTHHVSLFMQERTKWQDLTEDYNKLRAALTEAFGEPIDKSESFSTTEAPATDEAKMAALRKDLADFTTKYSYKRLTVMLSIVYTADHGAHVGLLFIDSKLSDVIMNAVGGAR